MGESASFVGCSCNTAVSGVALDVESELQLTITKNGMTTAATEMIREILI